MYLWQRSDWPAFRWDAAALAERLATASRKQGRLLGRMESLGFDSRQQAAVETLTEDVVKTSEIEGDHLDRDDVRSSLARRLGLPDGGVGTTDRKVEGVVEMTLDATRRFDEPLTAARLQGWQAALFPTGRSGLSPIRVGAWRVDADGPMQVVSGALHRPRVHFEAPPAGRLEGEMQRFLDWFARREPVGLLRAGLAHLWFVTVHPFDDGNGRIARAIADQALAQLEGSPQRFYSLSSQIQRERAAYYEALEATQKGTLDVTAWLAWFLDCFARCLDGADAATALVLRKAGFWQARAGEAFTTRQALLLNRYLDGFDGKLTAKKWAAIGKCSVPTAQRDINDLLARGVLRRNEGGSKNTSYDVAGL